MQSSTVRCLHSREENLPTTCSLCLYDPSPVRFACTPKTPLQCQHLLAVWQGSWRFAHWPASARQLQLTTLTTALECLWILLGS